MKNDTNPKDVSNSPLKEGRGNLKKGIGGAPLRRSTAHLLRSYTQSQARTEERKSFKGGLYAEERPSGHRKIQIGKGKDHKNANLNSVRSPNKA